MCSSTFCASNAEVRKHLRLIQEAARHMTDRIVDPCHVHKSDPLAWATTDTRRSAERVSISYRQAAVEENQISRTSTSLDRRD